MERIVSEQLSRTEFRKVESTASSTEASEKALQDECAERPVKARTEAHNELLTQYLTLTEAAFKRQGFDVCNAQNDLTKNYLWMASHFIAADFALLSASLTVIENEAIESTLRLAVSAGMVLLIASIAVSA